MSGGLLVPRTIGLASGLCCPQLTPEFPTLLCGWKLGVYHLFMCTLSWTTWLQG